MFWPNLKSVSSPIPEIIAIGVLGLWVGLQTPNLGEEAIGGRRWYRSTSYRPSIVTFMRFRDIVAFVLQYAICSPPHL